MKIETECGNLCRNRAEEESREAREQQYFKWKYKLEARKQRSNDEKFPF